MKNTKCILGIVAIGFCLLFTGARILTADLPQPVWPAPNPTQWYWYEPETNLTVKQVDTIFKDVVATKISLPSGYSSYPNAVFSVKNVQPSLEKPKEKEKGNIVPWKSASIRIETYYTSAVASGPYTFFMPLDAIQKMFLSYNSNSNVNNNQWLLKITDADDSSKDFYFKDENSARKFGNAVASILTQNGFSLKFSKLGLFTGDLTPAQAEALEKTRIDSALVTFVAIDGPADKANIQFLDVITEVNGTKVKNSSHFNSLVDGIASDAKVTLTCLQRTEVADKDPKQFVWKPKVVEMTAR